jgi:SNF2 family DNA or RNA helicase
MEAGSGKSKVIIDNLAYLYQKRKIEASLVIAPNGVHRNWAVNEFTSHMPERVPTQAVVWNSSKTSKKYRTELAQLFDGAMELKILLMNVEAFSTRKGTDFARRFLENFGQSMMIVDESSRLKNPKAKRTKNIVRMRTLAKYRRILTGTPVTQSPLDIYPQFYFLDPDIFGFSSFYAFKHYFAVVVKRETEDASGRRYTYEDVVQYRNLDVLTEKVGKHSFRITKDECLDLPPRITTQILVELSPEQKRVYRKLKDDLLLEVAGEELPVVMQLTKLLRLHQICGGFLATESGSTVPIEGTNAKLAALLDDIETLPNTEQVIIWAKFRAEIEAITQALRAAYGARSADAYYGSTSGEDRADMIQRFQGGALRFFVATQQAAGMGLTLTAGRMVYRFSNPFSLEDFLQSNDRNHRIGQDRPVVYKDIVAIGTIDGKVIKALNDKKSLADMK